MIRESSTIDTADGPMRLYEAAPDEPKTAVIVVMEAFGLNAHIEDVAGRLAAEGYHAVAPDFFHRSGLGTAPYDDFAQVMNLFEGVTAESVELDLAATVADLESKGFPVQKTGITGFCWGGWVTFLGALRHRFGAAVTWYGGGIVKPGGLPFPPLVDEAASLTTPWLGLFGGLDQMIPGEDLDRLEEALGAASAATEIVRYPDADHGFHCDARPDSYNAAAAADGWQRMLSWFGSHLG